MELSLYNTVSQIIDAVTVESNSEMYSIFSDIEDLLIEISFPVVLEFSDGQQITINDNYQLEEEIDRVIDSCDEDDEYEFDDADYPFVELIRCCFTAPR